MLCIVCSTLITVKSTLDDPINVKVVIFLNFFARLETCEVLIFVFLTKSARRQEKSARQAAAQITYQAGEHGANIGTRHSV